MTERPEYSPGMPGREAEDMPGDGEAVQSSPDPDRNLTLSGAGEDQRAEAEGSQGQADGGAVEQDLAALLGDAEAKRDEYLELARRAQADFENYRKRMAAEVQAAALRGKVEVARGVVGVLDDLERALGAAGLDPEGDSEDPLAHGVLLVFRNLRETLGRSGVEVVDPKGEKFDPNFAEALSTVAVEGTEAGVVVEVMQKGYRFEGQLIRPAMVVVAA
ncbi:MAG TPA: nucleotide exchange factor GrpE [Solirubrobacterales bacterium]|jgi:molecular chaperone GrpE|nr:nucleotide exchange factor GrpE [Solirubrobacterales bacterium]